MKDERKVIELNMDDILPNRFQPRITFGEDAINELAESIKEHGVIQPIVVRRINDKYEIIAGERRFKASKIAGKTNIPAIITDLNDKESAEIALIENVQREDLTPIEEAVSYKKILDMGYLTQEELSSKLGKKQSTISNKLRLLNLDEEVQEALLEKKISERHARSLLKLEMKSQRDMLNRIITERLTVRKTDEEIEKIINLNPVKEEVAEVPENIHQEIEVLDLDAEEGKEEIKMNNNDVNQSFNIPVEPIIEEETSMPGIVPNNVIKEEPLVENNVGQQISPAFMDVDKIASTATDINIEKPAIDMDNLLKPTPQPEQIKIEEPAVVDTSIFGFTPQPEDQSMVNTVSTENMGNLTVENNEADENILRPGKFFDLNVEENINDNTNSNLEVTTTPSDIELALNNSVSTETPKIEAVEEIENNVDDSKSSSMFGINLEPKNPDFIENVDTKEANLDFNIPNPTIDSNNMNFDSFYDNKIENQTTPEVEIPEIPTQTQNDFSATQIVNEPVEKVSFMNPIENSMREEMQTNAVESSIDTISKPVEPIVESVQAPVEPAGPTMPTENLAPVQDSSYKVPTADELDAFLSNIDSTTPLTGIESGQPVENETIDAASPTGVVTTPTEPGTKSVDQNIMDQVISIMRETKDKIAALGISIDLDEFDFDDMYQAIFKIDK